jgi:hypothetical protein
MINARFLCDAKLSAQKGRTDFGHQLFCCIGSIGKALTQLSVEPVFRSAPVRKLVHERGVVALAAGHGRAAAENGRRDALNRPQRLSQLARL